MSRPWIEELQNSIPVLSVLPHLRVIVINYFKEKYSYIFAMQLESIAMHYAHGNLKCYKDFVTYARVNDISDINQYELFCCQPDSHHQQLSSINIKRDKLIFELTTSQFECPEITEISRITRKCPQCGCTKLQSYAKQTRGADEGQTIFYTCENPKCKKQFR